MPFSPPIGLATAIVKVIKHGCSSARIKRTVKYHLKRGIVGSVVKKRRKRMSKKKHRKLLRKTRHQRRNKK